MQRIVTAQRLLVKRTEVNNVTPGGIVIPEAAQEKPCQGTVELTSEVSDFRVGDTIYFSRYSGNELELSGEKFVILHEDDVFLIERA